MISNADSKWIVCLRRIKICYKNGYTFDWIAEPAEPNKTRIDNLKCNEMYNSLEDAKESWREYATINGITKYNFEEVE